MCIKFNVLIINHENSRVLSIQSTGTDYRDTCFYSCHCLKNVIFSVGVPLIIHNISGTENIVLEGCHGIFFKW